MGVWTMVGTHDMCAVCLCAWLAFGYVASGELGRTKGEKKRKIGFCSSWWATLKKKKEKGTKKVKESTNTLYTKRCEGVVRLCHAALVVPRVLTSSSTVSTLRA